MKESWVWGLGLGDVTCMYMQGSGIRMSGSPPIELDDVSLVHALHLVISPGKIAGCRRSVGRGTAPERVETASPIHASIHPSINGRESICMCISRRYSQEVGGSQGVESDFAVALDSMAIGGPNATSSTAYPKL